MYSSTRVARSLLQRIFAIAQNKKPSMTSAGSLLLLSLLQALQGPDRTAVTYAVVALWSVFLDFGRKSIAGILCFFIQPDSCCFLLLPAASCFPAFITGMALRLCKVCGPAVAEAQKRAKVMGKIKNSFMNGKGYEVGFTGERGLVEVLNLVGFEARIADNYQYDIGVALPASNAASPACDGSKGPRGSEVSAALKTSNVVKLEVKTKTTSATPQPHYENSVSAFNATQAADVYVFLRVEWQDQSRTDLGGNLWFCGFVPCAELKARARFVKVGERDGDNNYVCRSDCWSLPISKCGSWADFRNYLQTTALTKQTLL